MYKKVLATLLLVFPTFTLAQKTVNVTLLCNTPDNITKVLEKYNEKLAFAGLDTFHNVNGLNVTLFLNKSTKSYSVLFTTADNKLVCVISSGEIGEMFAN